jgi:hypothetical protein
MRREFVVLAPIGIARFCRNKLSVCRWDEIACLTLHGNAWKPNLLLDGDFTNASFSAWFEVRASNRNPFDPETAKSTSIGLDESVSGNRLRKIMRQFWGILNTNPFDKGLVVINQTNGKELRVNGSLLGFRRLSEVVQRETFNRRWPRAFSKLLSGSTISFGELGIALSGLFCSEGNLSWNDIQEMEIKFRDSDRWTHLEIWKRGLSSCWHRILVFDIPNPHVLMALVTVARQRCNSLNG